MEPSAKSRRMKPNEIRDLLYPGHMALLHPQHAISISQKVSRNGLPQIN